MRLSIPCLCALVGAALYLFVSQTLCAQENCADGGLLVDYGDNGYSEGGAWEDAPSSYYTSGQSSTDVRQSGQDGAWAQWSIKVPTAGKYRVYFWHLPSTDLSAKIEVTHNGTTDTITRNMKYGHIGWSTLGDFDFAAGSDATVKITRGEGLLLVDSMKIISLQDYKPPTPLPPYPKPDGTSAHVDDKGNLILNGQPYPVLYAELSEETVATPATLPYADEVFDIAQAQGVNTLGTTIMWRDFETSPGVYDYTVIDALVEKAKARNMHLDLILFFAWRNLQSYYVPAWIAKDHATYPGIKLPGGTDDPHYKVSPFADATRAAETKALQALFQRIVEKDPDHQVVIMAQLENEMPCMPDYSDPALAVWNAPVPKELMDYLVANEGKISRFVWNQWQKNGHKTEGTWTQVFGDDNKGRRFFGVWCMGHYYIEPLVTDLKKVLNIPLYSNAWQHESPSALEYMDIFHAAAPDLDGMGPDAYGPLDKWGNDVGLSYRPNVHMVIAEQHHTANTLWRAIATYNALISGEYFGVEGSDWMCSRETFALFTSMYPLIASKRGSGDMLGFFQNHHGVGQQWSDYYHDLKVTYIATVRPHTWTQYNLECPAPCEKLSNTFLAELDGGGILVSLGDGKYVITSTRLDIALSYINGGPISVTDAQTGHFENGNWVSEGPAQVQQEGARVRFSFPTENRHFGQILFKLASTASNPAQAYEAERGNLLKEAEPIYSYGASGAFGVTSLKNEGDGVEIATHAGFTAGALTLRYACQSAAKAAIFVDGKDVQDVDFPATGSATNWAEKTVALSVPQGSTLSIQAKKGMQGPSLDSLILSRDPPAQASASDAK